MESRGTGFGDVVQSVPTLLDAGRDHREHPRHVQAAACAVRPEAHLPPDHCVPERLLCRVVRRLDPWLLHERPQVHRHLQDVVARGGHLLRAADLPLDQEILDLDLQAGHSRLEGGPRERSVPHRVPPLEHRLGLVGQLLADHPSFAGPLREALEVPEQVRPAELARPGVEAIGAPAVGDQHSLEGSQELPGRLAVAPEVDEEHRHQGGGGHPQPGLLTALPPAGLVGVQAAGPLDVLVGFFDRLLDRQADLGLAGRNGPQADVQPVKILEQGLGLALAEPVGPGQQRDQGMHPGAEGAGRRPGRQRRGMHLAAPGADAREELDLVELGLDDLGQLHPLVAPGVGLVARQPGPAVAGRTGEDLPEVGDLVGVHQLSVVSLVARLTAGLAAGLGLLLARELGRVAGWRL